MSKREYAAKRLNEFMHHLGHVNAEQIIDFIIDAVREEEDSRKVDCAKLPDEQGLIQGYTAEQWQEIIDGGYLCEFFSDGADSPEDIHFGALNHYDYPEVNYQFYSDAHWSFPYCRPAQIKGVMRPIFVEPVDKENECHFFRRDGKKLACYDANDNRGFPHRWAGFIKAMKEKEATSYIEL